MTPRSAKQATKEMREMIARFPGFEPESLKCQPFMVPFATLTGWADAIEAELKEKDSEIWRLRGLLADYRRADHDAP